MTEIGPSAGDRRRISGGEAGLDDLCRLADLTADVLIVTDDRGRVRFCNDAGVRTYATTMTELVGRRITDFVAEGEGREAQRRLVDEALAGDGWASGRVPTIAVDGSVLDMDVTTVRDPATGNWYSVQRNVTEIVRRQRQLERLNAELRDAALTDELTGLANRRALLIELDRCLRTGEAVALAMFDMDEFRIVNDTLGHGHGDQLLRFAADRLAGAARPSDMIARFGSDEFFALLRNVDRGDDAIEVALSLRDRIAEPYVVDQRVVQLSCSAGVALGDAVNDTAGDLLRHVDIATNKAKERGRSVCVLFDGQLRDEIQARFDLESDLRRALIDDQIDIALQGIFDARDRRLVGFEALARWHHPDRGSVPPDQFIELAEKTGVLDDIAVVVLTKGLEHLADWLRTADTTLSINFAPSQLRAAGMPDRLLAVLEVFAVAPESIVVEITEVGLTGALDEALPNLQRLRQAGFHLAIDDFGKGASSLGYLRSVPLSVVKIDGGFVHRLSAEHFAATITGSVIDLASRLGLVAVAECVETEEQLARLVAMGCHRVQGYLLHRPCPGPEAAALVADGDVSASVA
ncbi:MAG: putative bifunctional diguanylate cyclase/phosphodiesterase [Acidimicrobiales bacterium]